MVRLTRTVKTSGCAAKLPSKTLNEILSSLPLMKDENLIVGFETSDDALVYDLDGENLLVESVDFFPPVADDPYEFAQVAAANALSDLYAMGAVPKLAMNIMCFPSCMDLSIMKDILLGAQDKAREAGCVIAGGHTIADSTIKFGLAVTGFTTKKRLWTNKSAREGDVIVITKKLGVGIINTAAKAEMADECDVKAALESMKTLNKKAFETACLYDIHAATDITGFSLLGHLYEMAEAASLSVRLDSSSLPYFSASPELARLGLIPEGAYHNRDYIEDKVHFASSVPREITDIMFDPQTSGPLCLAMSEDDALSFVREFGEPAAIIGCFTARDGSVIDVS